MAMDNLNPPNWGLTDSCLLNRVGSLHILVSSFSVAILNLAENAIFCFYFPNQHSWDVTMWY